MIWSDSLMKMMLAQKQTKMAPGVSNVSCPILDLFVKANKVTTDLLGMCTYYGRLGRFP
jgi:hypothetical protein